LSTNRDCCRARHWRANHQCRPTTERRMQTHAENLKRVRRPIAGHRRLGRVNQLHVDSSMPLSARQVAEISNSLRPSHRCASAECTCRPLATRSERVPGNEGTHPSSAQPEGSGYPPHGLSEFPIACRMPNAPQVRIIKPSCVTYWY
jgi:hypothetical protein